MCGGTSLNVSDQAEHWEVKNHNPQQVNGVWYMSLLIADGAGLYATYVMMSRRGKEALREWTSHLLRMSPKFACAVAVRKVENWTEIRVGFKENVNSVEPKSNLVPENGANTDVPSQEIDLMKTLTQSLASQQT